MALTLDELVSISKTAIESIGLKVSDEERANSFHILRIMDKKDQVTGSFTISPKWCDMNRETAVGVIKSQAIEACTAAMKQKEAHK